MPSPKTKSPRPSGGFSYLSSDPPAAPLPAAEPTIADSTPITAKPAPKRPYLKRSVTPRGAASRAAAAPPVLVAVPKGHNNNSKAAEPPVAIVPSAANKLAGEASNTRHSLEDVPVAMRRSIELFSTKPAVDSSSVPHLLPEDPVPWSESSPLRVESNKKRSSGKGSQKEVEVVRSSGQRGPEPANGRASVVILDAADSNHLDKKEDSKQPRSSVRESLNRKSAQRRLQQGNALRSALSFCLTFTGICTVLLLAIAVVVMSAMPLFAIRSANEQLLTREAVASLTTLQSLYQQPYMSLNASETRCLYKTVLRDSLDRLGQAVATLNERMEGELKPSYVDQRIWQRNVARAYNMARHRARLYARSRDSSFLAQWIGYPVRDAWVYGVQRHGLWHSATSLLLRPSLTDLYRRSWDMMVCLRQTEFVACPSIEFLEEKALHRYANARRGEHLPQLLDDKATWEAAGKIEGGVEVNHQHGSDSVDSLEFDTFLAKYVVESSSRSNREYDDMYCHSRLKDTEANG